MLEENDRPLTLDDYEDPASNLPLAQSDAVMALAAATSDLARAVNKINYTPTTWVDNNEPDINAANLNKIEQGILQATTAINGAVDAINAINGNLGYISKISTWNPTWISAKMATTGIYALTTSDVNKLSDLPTTFNSRIYMEALKAVSDETVYKIYNPHGKLSYVGFQYGTNAPIEWKQFITNTDLQPKSYNVPQPTPGRIFTLIDGWGVYVHKSGKVVTIRVNIGGNMAASKDAHALFTLPIEYRPIVTVISNYITQKGAVMLLDILPSGEFRLANFSKAINDDWLCRQQITYVAND